MPIAAHTTGGHSTLDLVLGIAILLWALASVTALLSWLTRLPRRYRKRTADHRWQHSRFGRLRVASASVTMPVQVRPSTPARR